MCFSRADGDWPLWLSTYVHSPVSRSGSTDLGSSVSDLALQSVVRDVISRARSLRRCHLAPSKVDHQRLTKSHAGHVKKSFVLAGAARRPGCTSST
jgi:hypothetical protein